MALAWPLNTGFTVVKDDQNIIMMEGHVNCAGIFSGVIGKGIMPKQCQHNRGLVGVVGVVFKSRVFPISSCSKSSEAIGKN